MWEFYGEAPIYAQLMERVERRIVSGTLAPGERLPSVRALALEAGVNPNTVQKALTELERGGLIYSQRTAGHFVTRDPEKVAAVRDRLARQETARFLARMAELGLEREEIEGRLRRQLNREEGEANGDSVL